MATLKLKKNEAFIQYVLMKELEAHGFTVYPEQIFKLKGRTKRNRYQRSTRVDIVVVIDKRLLCIVEVKKKRNNKKSTIDKIKSGRQFKNYKELKIPFFYCINMIGIESVITKVNKLYYGE